MHFPLCVWESRRIKERSLLARPLSQPTAMRRTVFAAWALALCVSSADAFMPAASPARAFGLRPAAATSGSASRLHMPGCACGSCGSAVRKGSAKLSMAFNRGEDTGDLVESDGMGMDSQTYASNLDTLFPGAVDEQTFIATMSRVVQDRGFNPLSAINLVSTCRDEICRPFTEKLDAMWGEHFSISSLGGMVFCGEFLHVSNITFSYS